MASPPPLPIAASLQRGLLPLPRPGASRPLAPELRAAGRAPAQGANAGIGLSALPARRRPRRRRRRRPRRAVFVVRAGASEAAGGRSSGVRPVSRRVEKAAGSSPGSANPSRRRGGPRVCVHGRGRGQHSPPSLPAFHCAWTSEAGRLLCPRGEALSTTPPLHSNSLQSHEHTLNASCVNQAPHGVLWSYKKDRIRAPV